mmetsp:Transcript_31280/g.87854  ORF Transcript_31280/g.87854 Transcript_31280/m.87854 type:complete len:228 (-) Transcript_31280:193-876(-)
MTSAPAAPCRTSSISSHTFRANFPQLDRAMPQLGRVGAVLRRLEIPLWVVVRRLRLLQPAPEVRGVGLCPLLLGVRRRHADAVGDVAGPGQWRREVGQLAPVRGVRLVDQALHPLQDLLHLSRQDILGEVFDRGVDGGFELVARFLPAHCLRVPGPDQLRYEVGHVGSVFGVHQCRREVGHLGLVRRVHPVQNAPQPLQPLFFQLLLNSFPALRRGLRNIALLGLPL